MRSAIEAQPEPSSLFGSLRANQNQRYAVCGFLPARGPASLNGKTRVFGFSEQPVTPSPRPRHPVAIPSSQTPTCCPSSHQTRILHPASHIASSLNPALSDSARRDAASHSESRFSSASQTHLEPIYFRPLDKKVRTGRARAPRSALASPCPVPITVHRASKSAGLLRCTSEIMPGSGVTASAIPFQSRQCSTLVPVLESHEMAANFSMHLADAVGTLAGNFFAFVTSL